MTQRFATKWSRSSAHRAERRNRDSERRRPLEDGGGPEHRDDALFPGEEAFRQIAEHLEDMLAIIDRGSGRICYASPAFEAITGQTLSEVSRAGHGWLDWVHPADRERVEVAYARFVKGDPFDEEHRILRSDGQVRWVRARAFAIEEACRDVAIVQDITGERELEEELREAQKMEAVGALVSAVTHDFNNVLQVILGCVNVARDRADCPQELQRYLERTIRAVTRGSDLAKQLMGFVRKRESEPKPLVLDDAIGGVAKFIDRLVTEQVRVELRLGAPGTAMLADEVQIEQILMNLASNACDAMPEGGVLSIRTDVLGGDDPRIAARLQQRAARYVRLVVEDSGIGMDDPTRARIFEPFFTTKGAGKGTGLGLSTVLHVTEQLHGHVEIASERGRGTTFTFLFPCCAYRTMPVAVSADRSVRMRGRVLLVEDDPLIRLTVRHYLEGFGLDVRDAGGVDDAVELVEQHGVAVDLLLTDIVLPAMSGPKLAARLRARDPRLRVLFMSANPELLPVQTTCDRVLQKPFGKDELADSLAGLLPSEAEPR